MNSSWLIDLVDRDNRRLVDDDPLTTRVDARVRRAEVDRHVRREDAREYRHAGVILFKRQTEYPRDSGRGLRGRHPYKDRWGAGKARSLARCANPRVRTGLAIFLRKIGAGSGSSARMLSVSNIVGDVWRRNRAGIWHKFRLLRGGAVSCVRKRREICVRFRCRPHGLRG